MNAPARKSTAVTTKKAEAKPELKITEDELNEVLFPDLSTDQFKIGGQNFRIRVLPWRWERMFRKAAMPIIETELRPFERAILMFATDQNLIKEDLGMTHSFTDSEIDVDQHLTHAVSTICLSQDPKVLEAGQSGMEVPIDVLIGLEQKYRVMIDNLDEFPGESGRDYLRKIVTQQAEKLKLVQKLGESLMARFAELSRMLGTKDQFDSLRQGFTQQARSFMEKVGRTAGIPASSSSSSTGNGAAIRPLATLPTPPQPPPKVEEEQGVLEPAAVESSPSPTPDKT